MADAQTPIVHSPARTYGSTNEHHLNPPKQFPPHTFSFATKTATGNRVPQAIAHRGYKAKYPENTLSAFKGAVDVGADAIETDIHLSKDGVVVLSHDADLKRCFGLADKKIIDQDWPYLSTLRTLAAPHEGMPRLLDLLAYLAQPANTHIWALLDIKSDNDPAAAMRAIAASLAAVPAPDKRPWHHRIVLGLWSPAWLPHAHAHLPAFPIAHISFSLLASHRLLAVPHVAFNILHYTLRVPFFGPRFVRRAHARGRPVYAWTVNEPRVMRWAIAQLLDGVITDDPRLFLAIRDGTEDIGDVKEAGRVRQALMLLWINVLAVVFSFYFRWTRGSGKIPEGFVARRK